jgi:hypothetical protein
VNDGDGRIGHVDGNPRSTQRIDVMAHALHLLTVACFADDRTPTHADAGE